MAPLASALIIPGLFNSGPEHWQSIWRSRHPEYYRVQQADWETPRCSDWVQTLAASIREINGPVVLAAHSTACATVAYYAARHGNGKGQVVGALLVGPSDTEAASYPVGPTGFAPMPLDRLPFPSIAVASTDDPYVTIERAQLFASSWGSRLITLENAGHINAAAGYGAWPEGEELLQQLRAV